MRFQHQAIKLLLWRRLCVCDEGRRARTENGIRGKEARQRPFMHFFLSILYWNG